MVELGRHEEIAALLLEERYKDSRECEGAGKAARVFDWAGEVEARARRRSNPEYRHPARLEMLGALVSVADLEGGRMLSCIHAYDMARAAGKKKTGTVSQPRRRKCWRRRRSTAPSANVFPPPPGRDKAVLYYRVRRLKIENAECIYDLAAQGPGNIQVNASCKSERAVDIELAAATKKDVGGYDD